MMSTLCTIAICVVAGVLTVWLCKMLLTMTQAPVWDPPV